MLETKLKIADALIELLKESELHEIQLSEIASNALVTPRSLRRHFKGKESILLFYLNYIISSVDFTEVNSVLAATFKYMEFWHSEEELIDLFKQRKLLHLVIYSNQEYSRDALFKVFEGIASSEGEDDMQAYLIDLLVFMESSLFRTWLYHDYHLNIEEAKIKVMRSYKKYKEIDL